MLTTRARASRFRRPTTPTRGLALTERDRALLEVVHRHRVVRAEHVQALLFSGRSRRACQYRLRSLWEHRYLDRVYLPVVLRDDVVPARATQPAYVLGWRGYDLLTSDRRRDDAELGRPKPLSHRTLEHHLVVTDWIVSILATPPPDGFHIVATEHDHRLARRAHAARRELARGRGALVPDGAVTWIAPDDRRLTVYVEVVRAQVRGGNRRLVDKLGRIADANNTGLFRRLYGHESVRAVLIAPPTERRAETLRALAERLPHARSLFWFAPYETSTGAPFATRFQPGSVLDFEWRDASGDHRTLRSLLTPGSNARVRSEPARPGG
ncbi:MAG: hypothetical protein JWO36_5733 [Myxococcales bacterium]|nr:hypothetical protein [Myxococcales bacterium]